jgi:putative ABC transport system permease protein
MVLSLAGGLLGLLPGVTGTLMTPLISGYLPADEVGISRGVLLLRPVIIADGLAFGIVPALQSSLSQLTEDLKEARKGASGSIRSRRSLNALVVIEIALAIVLVAGAGLMMRSFRSVLGIDPGFNPHNVLTFSSALPLATYKDQQQQLQFFERALAKVQALPGVQSAAGVFRVPIAGFATAIFSVQGKPVPAGQAPAFADYRPITVDYFRAMAFGC